MSDIPWTLENTPSGNVSIVRGFERIKVVYNKRYAPMLGAASEMAELLKKFAVASHMHFKTAVEAQTHGEKLVSEARALLARIGAPNER